MPVLDVSRWEIFLSRHPEAHLLQSSAWGLFKDEFGWTPAWVQVGDAGAQVLFRRLPLGFSVAYIPKGPVGSSGRSLAEIDALCQEWGQCSCWLNQMPGRMTRVASAGSRRGFVPDRPVQPRQTILLSLEAVKRTGWRA